MAASAEIRVRDDVPVLHVRGDALGVRSVDTEDLPTYLDKLVDAAMIGRPRLHLSDLWRLLIAAFKGQEIDLKG